MEAILRDAIQREEGTKMRYLNWRMVVNDGTDDGWERTRTR